MDEVFGLRLAAESAKQNLIMQAELYEQLGRDFREARSALEESSSLRQASDRELRELRAHAAGVQQRLDESSSTSARLRTEFTSLE